MTKNDGYYVLPKISAVGKAWWANPYVDASLTIWNQQAIDAIEDGSFRELSCAYRYTPDFMPGKYEGVDYDFVMRNIRGNHVALVEEGRAGADVLVADSALDGKEDDGWATENGKHIHFKDKEIDKGNIGQKDFSYKPQLLESIEPDIERYQELLEEKEGNHREAAHEYFKEKLQGRYIEGKTNDQPIQANFTGATWNKIRDNMKIDPVKAELVAYMPDIISTGEYKEETPSYKHENFNKFHTYRKKIMTSQGEKEAIVDVAERKYADPKYQVYSLNREGTPSYERRKQKEQLENTPGGTGAIQSALSKDSNAINDNNITPQYEVVNIRFADETPANITRDAKPKTIGGGIMRKIKKWFKGAKDANPDIERTEVDLAQSILDLHKVDPETGEIVDITEDEDKAGEIRKIVGEISGKLEPEELKKLNDALQGLAYSKATGDEEPKKESTVSSSLMPHKFFFMLTFVLTLCKSISSHLFRFWGVLYIHFFGYLWEYMASGWCSSKIIMCKGELL